MGDSLLISLTVLMECVEKASVMIVRSLGIWLLENGLLFKAGLIGTGLIGDSLIGASLIEGSPGG